MICRLNAALLPIGLTLLLALSLAQIIGGGLAGNGPVAVTAVASLVGLVLTLRRRRPL
jgi:hypothetical protein